MNILRHVVVLAIALVFTLVLFEFWARFALVASHFGESKPSNVMSVYVVPPVQKPCPKDHPCPK
jgi:hypothetical protein